MGAEVILSKRDTILGAGIVGPRAGELIAPSQFAIPNALKVGDLLESMADYPTLSEALQRVVVMARASHLPDSWTAWVRRAMGAFG